MAFTFGVALAFGLAFGFGLRVFRSVMAFVNSARSLIALALRCAVGEKDAWEVYSEAEESAGQIPDGKAIGDFILDSDGNKEVKSQTVDQSKIVPLLVKTVLELEARIKTLEDA